LTDPRARSCSYQLDELLLASICAVINDAESWSSVVEWSEMKLAWLRQHLPSRGGREPRAEEIFRQRRFDLRGRRMRVPLTLCSRATSETEAPGASDWRTTARLVNDRLNNRVHVRAQIICAFSLNLDRKEAHLDYAYPFAARS
jgi:hypothetical protein